MASLHIRGINLCIAGVSSPCVKEQLSAIDIITRVTGRSLPSEVPQLSAARAALQRGRTKGRVLTPGMAARNPCG